MGYFSSIAETIHAMAQGQARWEYQLSTAIFRSKRSLLLLGLLVLPALVFVAVGAFGAGPAHMPSVLGGAKAYMPSMANATMFYGSILVGLIAGLITGVIGAGGGYILTPALMSFGIRGIMAVGTDQFHLFAKAIIGTAIHKKLGNVHTALAAWFVLGSFGGVTLGGIVNRKIFQLNPAMSDVLISTVYVLVLGLLGGYAIYDWYRLRRQPRTTAGTTACSTTQFAEKLQQLSLPPFIKFDQQIAPPGRRISVYPVILCGFIVGVVASIMGVGGGFLTFPMFVYGLGVSTFTTVGTDILQIIFTTAYSSIFQYAIYGFVFYTIAIGMLLGSLVGVQIGALVTKVVTGSEIRALYALTIIAGFVNRLCALPRRLSEMGFLALDKQLTGGIEQCGNVVFFAIVGVFALWILRIFAHNLQHQQLRPGDGNSRPGWIVKPRKFALGVAGIVVFFLIFAAGVWMPIQQWTALTWSDALFNQMAKKSSDFLAEATKKSTRFAGKPVEITLHPSKNLRASFLTTQLNASGADAQLLQNGNISISGDLGGLATAALTDARFAYHNQQAQITQKYHYDSDVVLYNWWFLFDALSKQYLSANKKSMSDFSQTISTKALEPAYNFRGIYAQNARQLLLPISLLLLFYVLYTILYGCSIFYLFEGLGITVEGFAKKLEC